MKIWLAGNTGVYKRELRIRRVNPYRLISYHYIGGVLITLKVDRDMAKKKKSR